jgi:hypothetical protein
MFASCVSAPTPQARPEWYYDIDTVYPQERYIAYLGQGRTRTEAEYKARLDLAAYFEQEVRKEGMASISMTERQGSVEKTRRIEETISVTITQNLQGVRYARDAWKDPVTGEYVTVAYIDREAVWEMYRPQAQNAADTCTQLCYGAREEHTDPFTRALSFGKAEAYAAGEEFITARSFAQGLYPARAKELFEEADGVRAALLREAAEARRNASVYLECPLDFNGLIRAAAMAAFRDAGFTAAAENKGAQAVCVIEVEEGLMPRPPGTGTYYQSELSGVVTSRTGAVVFSFTVQSKVVSAIDKDMARSRAYTALAQALRETLPERLRG